MDRTGPRIKPDRTGHVVHSSGTHSAHGSCSGDVPTSRFVAPVAGSIRPAGTANPGRGRLPAKAEWGIRSRVEESEVFPFVKTKDILVPALAFLLVDSVNMSASGMEDTSEPL